MYEYFHWNGNYFVVRGVILADSDLDAFEKACKKLKLFHRGNIAVQKVAAHVTH